MPNKSDDKKNLRCSFCGRPQLQVNRLIAGSDACICDECVRQCMDIIGEDFDYGYTEQNANAETLSFVKPPRPAEIRSVIDEYSIGQDWAK